MHLRGLIMEDIIFENVPKLKTPVGEFRVSTDNGEEVLFSVQKNSFDSPYDIYSSDKARKQGSIATETNFTILIPTASLTVGAEYTIHFDQGAWAHCDSTEHAICYSATIEDWVIGIGSFVPGDATLENKAFDEAFVPHYTVEGLAEFNGFKFKLLDDSLEFVPFDVAWLKADMMPVSTCLKALGFWLC